MKATKRKATGNNWKPQRRYLVAHQGQAHKVAGDYVEVTGRPGMAKREIPKVKVARRARRRG